MVPALVFPLRLQPPAHPARPGTERFTAALLHCVAQEFFSAGFLGDSEDKFILKDREEFYTSAQRSQIVWQASCCLLYLLHCSVLNSCCCGPRTTRPSPTRPAS